MSGEMSETIFVVNQIGSGCYGFPSEPQIDKYGNWCGYGWFRLSESYMPPPGECWEYRLTRKGDIDTDGDPIGWKIVGIGKDGSVLCEKGNGQRRRYSFGDGAKEQPSGEAWEFCQRLVDMVGAEGPEDVQGMLDKVNAELHRLKQNIDSMSANLADKEGFLNSAGDEIERLTKERDEAVTELRDKLERPEMPECVRELLDAVCLEVPGLFAQKIAAVRDHYAPPAGQPDRRGLQMRYRVLKADGSPADPRAKYFVLRLDWDGRDKEHVAACRKAAEAYILNAPDHMRQFSRELAEWVDLWPAGHEWQPVDDANPITAADVGRKVAFRLHHRHKRGAAVRKRSKRPAKWWRHPKAWTTIRGKHWGKSFRSYIVAVAKDHRQNERRWKNATN